MTTRREPETTTARAARSHVEDAVRWALVVGYWTTPLPHRPSRRARATRAQVAEQVRDLGDPRAPGRFSSRFSTVAGADEDRVRIHVTWRQDWPVVFTARVTSRSTIPAALTCR